MANFTKFQIDIFHKLWRNRCFGKGHMLIDNVVNGFPKNIQKNVKNELDDLIRKNYLIKKPSQHGYCVYINLDNKQKIEKAIKNMYSFYIMF